MRKENVLKLMMFVVLLSMQNAAQSEGEMTFRGTLIEPPPCTINDNGLVDVDFGDRIGVNKVDGINYRRAINYQISCDNSGGLAWALTLTLKGSPASFDNNALLTNKASLGILVYQNDQPFTPGTTLPIDLTNPPRLEAVPVKEAAATLSKGAFEAWATLRADYQ